MKFMRYQNTCTGIFLERPNRFIAFVEIEGAIEKCHVKNTGRCKELLIKGNKVVLEKASNPNRKTQFDLIATYKENLLINMDSQIPNKVVLEAFNNIIGKMDLIKPEYVYGDSRIDIYAESKDRKILVEVKGVTLEQDGVCLFPDAPTKRGLKHIKELERAVEEGYECYIIFLIQMLGMKYFTPNYEMQKVFGIELEKAKDKGVNVLAYDCNVTEDSIILNKKMEVRFLNHS